MTEYTNNLRPGPKEDTHVEQLLVRARWQNAEHTLILMETTEAHYEIGSDHARWEQAKAMADPYIDEPEEIEIPRFLAPDPVEGIPDALLDLAEPGETVAEMQARLWELWREMNGKLMLNIATPEEIALHTRLHNELHWIAPPIEGDE